jgi:tRNA (guanine37-N1)-methyltransferase
MDVPAVLLSGDHEKIAAWRAQESERLTRERRPDIWAELDPEKET